MKKFIFALLFVVFVVGIIFAEYNVNVKNGDEAYANKDYEIALGFYKRAYAEKPNQDLKVLIQAIEKKIVSTSVDEVKPAVNSLTVSSEPATKVVYVEKEEKKDNTVLATCGTIALVALAVIGVLVLI
ncbi:MAG: hypothetical protein JXR81_01850 [Candidatus Goldbacteria bacterium]|nr:hypothetical protein [Candidatus Goldiibacteriota bacterium]